MKLVFGSKEANEILAMDKGARLFGPSSLEDHEAITPVDLRIADLEAFWPNMDGIPDGIDLFAQYPISGIHTPEQ